MHFTYVCALNVYAFHMMCERGPKKKSFKLPSSKEHSLGKKNWCLQCVCVSCVREGKGGKKTFPLQSSREYLENLRLPVSMLSVLQCVVVCCSVLQCVAVCCTFQLPSSREYFENLRIPVSMLRLIRTLSPGNSFGTYLCGSVCCSACCGVCCNACCRVCCRACWGLHAVCHLDMASAPTRVAVCVAVRVAVCVAVCVAACVAERVGVYMQSVTWK